MILFDTLLASPEKVGHGRQGYYFAKNGQHTWVMLSQAIGLALERLGISKSVEPTTLNEAEVAKYGGTLVRVTLKNATSTFSRYSSIHYRNEVTH